MPNLYRHESTYTHRSLAAVARWRHHASRETDNLRRQFIANARAELDRMHEYRAFRMANPNGLEAAP